MVVLDINCTTLKETAEYREINYDKLLFVPKEFQKDSIIIIKLP